VGVVLPIGVIYLGYQGFMPRAVPAVKSHQERWVLKVEHALLAGILHFRDHRLLVVSFFSFLPPSGGIQCVAKTMQILGVILL